MMARSITTTHPERRTPMQPRSAARSRETDTIRKPRDPAQILILAGGDGIRLQSVTHALSGDDRPKQFCALVGREPLLAQTQRRAAMLVPPERVLLVLRRDHERFYEQFVAGAPPSSLVIQPGNRGTATAVLYGLLRIAMRAPNTPVLILPSDHWVSDDAAFMAHAAAAIGIAEAHENAVVLLGVAPKRAETEYGWIEPSEQVFEAWSALRQVRRFVEKPGPELARALQQSGTSLWNTAVVAGQVEALLYLFALARPALVDAFLEIWTALGTPSEKDAIERIYGELPAADFSKDILSAQPEALTVLAVRGVAWEDLGHPAGLLEARRRSRPGPIRVSSAGTWGARPSHIA